MLRFNLCTGLKRYLREADNSMSKSMWRSPITDLEQFSLNTNLAKHVENWVVLSPALATVRRGLKRSARLFFFTRQTGIRFILEFGNLVFGASALFGLIQPQSLLDL